MKSVVYDTIVVGSGASGAFAVDELTAQGMKVLLVEAGPRIGPEDFDTRQKPSSSPINLKQRVVATLLGRPVQSRATFYNDRMRHMYVNDWQHPYTTPQGAPFNWVRGRQAGGRTHTFGRVLLRWNDDDFKILSRTGHGVDWPISYEDLAPFYDVAESMLGLYGNADDVPTVPNGIYKQAAPLTRAEQLFKGAVENHWSGRKVIAWRYMAPEPTRVLTPLRQALERDNLTVRYNSIARRILTDPASGRATGVEIIDRQTKQSNIVEALSVVLCASPVESVRLMLNSASAKHPDGLGNGSGLLGRYFMDQLPSIATGTFPLAKGAQTADLAPADPFYGPSGGVYIPRFIAKDGVTGQSEFAFQGSVGRAIQSPEENSKWQFKGFGLMQPDASNRITLDSRRKDAWGIPAPHIRCKISDMDRQTLSSQVAAIAEIVEEAGGKVDFVGSPLGRVEKGKGAFPEADPISRLAFRTMFSRYMVMGNSIHESGGARMGVTPEDSVVNEYNQCWDVPNVFVTDASAFPGSGVSGTTLTIMALSIRACRHLAQNLRTGSL